MQTTKGPIMGKIAKPDGLTPHGAAAKLYDELHDLHERAGLPSTRELGRRLDLTATRVYNVMNGNPALPIRPHLLRIVGALAQLALMTDVQSEIERFDVLWKAARAELA